MDLIKRPSFKDFGWIRNELDRLTNLLGPFQEDEKGSAMTEWSPAVDVLEDDDAITIKADLPEVEKKDIEVSVESGTLTIKGERKLEHEEKKKDYRRIERSYGSYLRTFEIPGYVDTENIKAECKNGVLRVTLPKTESATSHAAKIEVK